MINDVQHYAAINHSKLLLRNNLCLHTVGHKQEILQCRVRSYCDRLIKYKPTLAKAVYQHNSLCKKQKVVQLVNRALMCATYCDDAHAAKVAWQMQILTRDIQKATTFCRLAISLSSSMLRGASTYVPSAPASWKSNTSHMTKCNTRATSGFWTHSICTLYAEGIFKYLSQ